MAAPDGPGVRLVRAGAVLALAGLFVLIWPLIERSLRTASSWLVPLEVLALAGVLVAAVLFVERLLVRIIRTRGGRRRG
jgi:phosphotransferase system  glucose/maltose/N-acetylglucosamine-specific IIC component